MREPVNIPTGQGTYLLWTEAEGGRYQILADFCTPEEYSEIVQRGWFEYNTGDFTHRVRPAYIAYLARLTEYDFRYADIMRNQSLASMALQI